MGSNLLLRLADASLSGTLAIVFVLLLCRFVPKLSGPLRCWLWWCICFKLIVSLFILPMISLPVVPRSLITASDTAKMQWPVPQPVSPVPPSSETTPVSSSEETASAPGNNPVPTSISPSVPVSPAMVLVGLWLIGVGVFLGAQAMALVQLRRLTRGAKRTEFPLLIQAAQQVGLRRVPALWVSPVPIEPMTIGGLYPAILLANEDMNRLSREELLPILTHECVHIRRGDLILSLIPHLTQTLFWFLPPVYLAMREFEIAREAACDQQTLAVLKLAPRAYGELLLKLSSPVSPLPVPASAMALSAGFRHLKRRIQMLEFKPSRRRLLLSASLVAAGLLLPWRLTIAAPPGPSAIPLPNLDFSQGLTHWYKMANGSDSMPHPFYSVGQDPSVTHEGKPTGYVRSNANIAKDVDGDGGVLRYDIDGEKYRGKRLRWSGYVLAKNLKKKAFLLAATTGTDKLVFATSPDITPQTTGWVKRECVIDVPTDTSSISLCLRLEGAGIVDGSGFTLEIVDKNVPLSAVKTISEGDIAASQMSGPENLDFSRGLDSWWNDNPTHDTQENYTMGLDQKGGRNGGPAAYLKSKVANPKSYGTIAQNASAQPYLGKRIRLSTYLKSENARQGELWIVINDKDPDKNSGANAETTGKKIQGTKDWTKIEHVLDIPKSTQMISFGISSEGPGTVWTDGFKIEVVDKS